MSLQKEFKLNSAAILSCGIESGLKFTFLVCIPWTLARFRIMIDAV